MTDKHDEKAREMVSEYWGVLTAGKQERLTKVIAADRRQVERAALERAAKVCYDADKSTHPTDLGNRIRALIESEKVQP